MTLQVPGGTSESLMTAGGYSTSKHYSGRDGLTAPYTVHLPTYPDQYCHSTRMATDTSHSTQRDTNSQLNVLTEKNMSVGLTLAMSPKGTHLLGSGIPGLNQLALEAFQ